MEGNAFLNSLRSCSRKLGHVNGELDGFVLKGSSGKKRAFLSAKTGRDLPAFDCNVVSGLEKKQISAGEAWGSQASRLCNVNMYKHNNRRKKIAKLNNSMAVISIASHAHFFKR